MAAQVEAAQPAPTATALAPSGTDADPTQSTIPQQAKSEDLPTENYTNGQDGEAGGMGDNGQTDGAQNGHYGYEPSESQGIGIKEDG